MNMKYFMNHKLMNHKGFQEFLEKDVCVLLHEIFSTLVGR